MRSADLGVIPGIIDSFTDEDVLNVVSSICRCRYFEQGLMRAVEQKLVTYPVYLSLGQEAVSAALASVLSGFMVFTQHRCHDTYLAFGGAPEPLRDELLGLPSGTSGGRAGSNCIQCHDGQLTMFGHHGLIGENVPQAVGAVLGSGRPAICFFGDGAAEEDYVLSAMGFAATHKLPLLFVCHDNDLSILTPTALRRSWSFVDVVRALGLPAIELSDDPWSIAHHARSLAARLPACLNVHVCRMTWHVGVGNDGPPEWDRFQLIKEQLFTAGMDEIVNRIEREIRVDMEKLWNV
jgi:acetoin:2,6-dichlorophenolindophenol oxidoreductase subunit alpha